MVHEHVRTILTRPAIMRDYVPQRNILLFHQQSAKLRRPVKRLIHLVIRLLAHFNADGISVTRTACVGMPPRFIQRKVSNRHELVSRKMPVVRKSLVMQRLDRKSVV